MEQDEPVEEVSVPAVRQDVYRHAGVVSHFTCTKDRVTDRIVYFCNACHRYFAFAKFGIHLRFQCAEDKTALTEPQPIRVRRDPTEWDLSDSSVEETEAAVTKPAARMPTVAKHTVAKHSVAKDTVAKPVVTKPLPKKPSILLKHLTKQPVVVKPVSTKPVVVKLVATKPVAAKPIVAKPIVVKPVATDPIVVSDSVPEVEGTVFKLPNFGHGRLPKMPRWLDTELDEESLKARYPLVTPASLPLDHADYTRPVHAINTQKYPLQALPKSVGLAKVGVARPCTNTTVQQLFKLTPRPKVPRLPVPRVQHRFYRAPGRPKLPCKYCTKRTFKFPIFLAAHEAAHRAHYCSVCDRYVPLATPLAKHVEKVHGPKLRKPNPPLPLKPCLCPHCGLTFDRSDRLKRHLVSKHEPRRFACAHCEYRSSTKSVLKFHVMTQHENNRPFVCEQCGLRAVSLAVLHTHQKRHADARPFACAHCPATFKNTNRLKSHTIDTHQVEVPGWIVRRCQLCQRIFSSRQKFEDHANIHSGARPYVCPFCPLAFRTRHTLFQHRQRHLDANLSEYVQCPKCDRKFPTEKRLAAHAIKMHPDSPATYTATRSAAFPQTYDCSHCGGTFTSRKSVCAHIKSKHLKRSRVWCVLCRQKVPETIKQHRLEVHGDDSPAFPCKVAGCTRAFYEARECTVHMREDHTENILRCERCNQAFAAWDRLRAHWANAHAEVRRREQPPCVVCGKVFRGSTNLKQHMQTHEEKTIECPECPAMFHRQVDKRKHMVKQHGPESAIFQCRFCPQHFLNIEARTRHESMHH